MNKGKPSKQAADERKEREVTDSRSPRTVHRLDRSRSEKGGTGATAARQRSFETPESVLQKAKRPAPRAR